jgi:hypothetical protein
MPFPCNQCNLTFASTLEVKNHINCDHVNMWAESSDEEVSWMQQPVTTPTQSGNKMESGPGSPVVITKDNPRIRKCQSVSDP